MKIELNVGAVVCSQVFCKVVVLKKFCKIHRKTSALESFDEVVGWRPQAYNFIEICKILKNTFL